MATDKDFLLNVNLHQVVSYSDSFTEERYVQFAKHLSSNVRKVIDVGGGMGRGGGALRNALPGIELTGLDCIQERVDAMPSAIYAQSVCAFADVLPFEDRSFDAIVAGEFIEHVPPEKVEATLCEFFRVLDLKGKLLLTTPNPNYLKNKLQGLSVLLDPSHVSQHYPRLLKRRLKEIGFSNVSIRGSGKVSRYVGTHLPLPIYGSYLIDATKW